MPSATLYEVQHTRGTIYALHDLSSGTIWTERSELSIRAVARERGLTIVDEQTCSHEDLLRKMGHEPPVTKPTAPQTAQPAKETSHDGTLDVQPAAPAIPPLQVQYHWDDSPLLKADDAIIIPRGAVKSVRNVFCTEAPVVDSLRSAAGGEIAKS